MKYEIGRRNETEFIPIRQYGCVQEINKLIAIIQISSGWSDKQTISSNKMLTIKSIIITHNKLYSKLKKRNIVGAFKVLLHH